MLSYGTHPRTNWKRIGTLYNVELTVAQCNSCRFYDDLYGRITVGLAQLQEGYEYALEGFARKVR